MQKSEKLLGDFASGKLDETKEDRKIKNEILKKALEDFRNKEELAKDKTDFTNNMIKKIKKKSQIFLNNEILQKIKKHKKD